MRAVAFALLGVACGSNKVLVPPQLDLKPYGTLALVTFNLGVELGQLAFVAAVLTLVAATRRLPRIVTARTAAVALGSVGVAWLVERVLAFWSPTS